MNAWRMLAMTAHDPLDTILADAMKRRENFAEVRQWPQAGVVDAMIVHCKISAAVMAQARSEALWARLEADDHLLSVIAISEARKLLEHARVPPSAFFDEHVRGAVTQRNLFAKFVLTMLPLIDVSQLPEPINSQEKLDAVLKRYGCEWLCEGELKPVVDTDFA